MPDCPKTIYIDSVEMLERTYPLHFRSLRLLADSGGAGRLRGGPAGEVVYGPRSSTPLRAFYLADFARNPPQGVRGGQPGRPASATVIDLDGSERQVEPVGDSLLAPGQWIKGVEAGGGGYGDPLERDPQAVLGDVLERWVSAKAASDVYGVVLVEQPGAGALAVDAAATRERRESLHAACAARGGRT
jgi:N-methylhydantoinase B